MVAMSSKGLTQFKVSHSECRSDKVFGLLLNANFWGVMVFTVISRHRCYQGGIFRNFSSWKEKPAGVKTSTIWSSASYRTVSLGVHTRTSSM